MLKDFRVVLLSKTLGGLCVAGAYGFGLGLNLYKIGKRLGKNEAVTNLYVRLITGFKISYHSDVNELVIHENYNH